MLSENETRCLRCCLFLCFVVLLRGEVVEDLFGISTADCEEGQPGASGEFTKFGEVKGQ